ncbi:hypothetical protein [Neobacillus sp. D3-1R]|uniref:hypothetical protein n=1 Tax=Neobacillus sp. D3-1R TaxID=3445778 RepID=UPI003FA02214
MKKLLVGFLFILAIILNACSFEKIDQIQVYEMESFSKVKANSFIKIEDKTEINQIRNAIASAKKQPGIVDMADPEFKIVMGKNSYYLWISKDSGTIMNLNDTYTIYSLTKFSAKRVGKILNEE